jgi:hypothetical protein
MKQRPKGDEVAVGEDAVGSKSSSTAESTDFFCLSKSNWVFADRTAS